MSITPLRRLFTYTQHEPKDLRVTEAMWRAGEIFERARQALPLRKAQLQATELMPSTRKGVLAPTPEPRDPDPADPAKREKSGVGELDSQQAYEQMVHALKALGRKVYDDVYNTAVMHRQPGVLARAPNRWTEKDRSELRRICRGLRVLAAMPTVAWRGKVEELTDA